jgi:hypothetical protein
VLNATAGRGVGHSFPTLASSYRARVKASLTTRRLPNMQGILWLLEASRANEESADFIEAGILFCADYPGRWDVRTDDDAFAPTGGGSWEVRIP